MGMLAMTLVAPADETYCDQGGGYDGPNQRRFVAMLSTSTSSSSAAWSAVKLVLTGCLARLTSEI